MVHNFIQRICYCLFTLIEIKSDELYDAPMQSNSQKQKKCVKKLTKTRSLRRKQCFQNTRQVFVIVVLLLSQQHCCWHADCHNMNLLTKKKFGSKINEKFELKNGPCNLKIGIWAVSIFLKNFRLEHILMSDEPKVEA